MYVYTHEREVYMEERFKKLMCELGWDHLVKENMSLDYMKKECEYLLDVYCSDDTGLRENDYKTWRSWIGKLKRFIAKASLER